MSAANAASAASGAGSLRNGNARPAPVELLLTLPAAAVAGTPVSPSAGLMSPACLTPLRTPQNVATTLWRTKTCPFPPVPPKMKVRAAAAPASSHVLSRCLSGGLSGGLLTPVNVWPSPALAPASPANAFGLPPTPELGMLEPAAPGAPVHYVPQWGSGRSLGSGRMIARPNAPVFDWSGQ